MRSIAGFADRDEAVVDEVRWAGPVRGTGLFVVLLSAALSLGCSHELKEGPTPTVEADQFTFCGGFETTFSIRGTGFSPLVVEAANEDARAELPQVCFERVEDLDGNPVTGEERVCLDESDVEWISKTQLDFTIGEDLGLQTGLYDIIVINPDGQEARGDLQLKIRAGGPLVFWADPAVTYNGISIVTTVYGSNLGGAVEEIAIRAEDGTETNVDFTVDDMRPNRFQATIPSGTAASVYDVLVRDQEGCQAELTDGLRVTDELTLALDRVEPSFGATDQDTPITIFGSGFQPIPRVYLNPTDGGANAIATPLRSVAVIDDSRLTAVVPNGLPVGSYDLFVVNPDGSAGLLEGVFTVIDNAPPVVENISPSSVDNGIDHQITMRGSGFRNPAVHMTCRAPDGSTTEGDGTVDNSTATQIDVTLPTTGLIDGSVCVLRVTNGDGSYFDFSALGITLPSANLAPFQPGTELTTGRRAPAVEAGRATRAARFLYAAGGDNGDEASAMTSIEATAVDIFGTPGSWFELPVALPSARTRAGLVQIDRYLYLVGGHDGSAPVTTVHRAQILDPLDAPVIDDIVARRGEGDGIGAGVWYYRVSAVMADDDPVNPGGETLPSDPLGVDLPETLDDTLVLTLFWEPVPGARGYRVYRSPMPDMDFGNELLLAEVDGGDTTSYEDVTGTPSGQSPRPLGATGEWVELASMSTARSSAAVTAAQDPADPSTWYIYAFGGNDGSGNLNTWERLDVSRTADGSWTSGTWTDGNNQISAARSELGVWSMTHIDAPVIPDDGTTVIYVGGGDGSTNVDAAVVQAGGDMGTWSAVDGMSPPRQGYGAVGGAGFILAFGGSGDGGVSAELEMGGTPPTLRNWNNEGNKLNAPRYLPGATRESAFIYIVGGENVMSLSTPHQSSVRFLALAIAAALCVPALASAQTTPPPTDEPAETTEPDAEPPAETEPTAEPMPDPVAEPAAGEGAGGQVAAGEAGPTMDPATDTGAQATMDWPADPEPGSLVLGVETGAMIPFTELDPHVAVAIEIGYMLPFWGRRLELFFATGWSPPGRTFTDDRGYEGDVTVHQLHFSVGPRLRVMEASSIWNVTIATGARINLIRSLSNGERNGESFAEYTEESTEVGAFGAIGGELRLGPGALHLDLDVGWSPLPHRITGDESTLNLTTTLGYRFMVL